MSHLYCYHLLLLLSSLLVIATMCIFNVYFGKISYNSIRKHQASLHEFPDQIPHLEWRKAINIRLSIPLPFQKYLILFYTNFYGTRPWTRRYATADNCAQHSSCQFTYDKQRFVESHAVLFHAHDMPEVKELQMLHNHPVRRQQVWIYFSMENPVISRFNPLHEHMFNLSMSYRLDADLRMPHRQFERRKKTLDKAIQKNYAEDKSRQIAWLVNNDCGKLGESLVDKLDELGLSIDAGGKCISKDEGEPTLQCKGENCWKTLKKYKFLLALENHFCKDEITDNYWHHALENNMIPIVLGGANYQNPLIAVPGSFINVLNFKTPQQLVDYIQELDRNNTLYNSYFRWKRYWRVVSPSSFECEPALTKLCRMLRKPLPVREVSFSAEFGNEGQCHKTGLLYRMWLIRTRLK